jgi:hypothetical protein
LAGTVRKKTKSASIGSDGHRINLAIFLPAEALRTNAVALDNLAALLLAARAGKWWNFPTART